MKYHAFNFCGDRDKELGELMQKTLRKYCPKLATLDSCNMDQLGYGNGAGWVASMLKLDAMRDLIKYVDDYDWVLSIDSDVVFTNSKVFDWLNVVGAFRYNNYGIVGIQQGPPLARCHMGYLHNMSGCSIYLRGGIAKRICNLTKDELASVREQFQAYVLAEQEDVVISYLAQLQGANPLPIPDHMYDGNLELDIEAGRELRCFNHLNYSPTTFLGEPVSGKWDIPRVLRLKGIEL